MYRDDHPPCPTCKTTSLSALTVVGVERWECASCGGLWIDREALESLADKLEVPVDALLVRGAGEEPRGCPRCKVPLRSLVVGDATLDTCPEHGLWFDRSELEATIDKLQADAEAARPARERANPPWWYRIYDYAVRVVQVSNANRNRVRPSDRN